MVEISWELFLESKQKKKDPVIEELMTSGWLINPTSRALTPEGARKTLEHLRKFDKEISEQLEKLNQDFYSQVE